MMYLSSPTLCALLLVMQISTGFITIKTTRPIITSTTNLFQTSSGAPIFENNWYDMNGCLVLLPKNERIPRSIIHFIGGFVAGNAPSVGYNYMLQDLAEKGHLIIASPVPISINHQEIADSIQTSFFNCYNTNIMQILGNSMTSVPVIGLSHSLGGKIRVLIEANRNSAKCIPTSANVYLAFNNYEAKQSLEMMGALLSTVSPELKKVVDSLQSSDLKGYMSLTNLNPIPTIKNVMGSRSAERGGDKETSPSGGNTFESVAGMFTDILSDSLNDLLENVDERIKGAFEYDFIPTAEKTWSIFESTYNNPSNILVQFEDDEIDQSNELSMKLTRSSFTPLLLKAKGNHVTPCAVGPDSIATTDFIKLLGQQMGRLADDNWGRAVSRGGGRYILPSGRADSKEWDSDEQ
jgi:Protein of unknown function (DUF1350)